MRQFVNRPHPWLMQALGGLIAVIAIAPVAAYVFINVINAKTTAEPTAFAPPPSAQGAAPASPAAPSGGSSQASGAAPAHPTWADVHAIFAQNCVGCHVGNTSGGLNLDTYQNALKGGSTAAGGVVNGAVIKPGDAAGSYLYQAVTGKQKVGQRMPLGGAPLPQKDVQTIYTWIQQGAKK
jgi:mono/diheme cytochrome c family protein